MSGRGCSITVYVNPGVSATHATVFGQQTSITKVHDNGMVGWILPLFVALHTPLEVLRGQLHEQTGFAAESQVLILCDLSDMYRNKDRVLDEKMDHYSLYDCDIREGSVLSLHPIGAICTTSEEDDEKEGTKDMPQDGGPATLETHTLSTPITAADADHSYNGIIFDVEAKGPYELSILSLSVGGMLGRVRIFTRDGSYERGETENTSGRWWAHHSSVTSTGWDLVADVTMKASWDSPAEILLDEPVKVLPRSRRAFYVHSGLPDDLGIQYQSYGADDIVAENEHLYLLPGLGHTGSEPFDEVNGWYRAHRGLAGSVKYTSRLKGWNIWEHALFPREVREAVRTMLLINLHASNMVFDYRLNNASLQNELSVSIPRPLQPVHSGASYYHHPTSNYMPLYPYDSLSEDIPGGVLLMSMPQFVVYYVMEFMHWDWFEELYYRNRDGGHLLGNGDHDEEDDEYERFGSRSHSEGRSGPGKTGGRSRQAHSRNGGHRPASSSSSSSAGQHTLARLLAHMYRQQSGEEDEEEDIIDPHTVSVMNSIFGGGINIFGGGTLHEDAFNEDSDDDGDGDDDVSDEDLDEEEETKEDIYAPSDSTSLWSSIPVRSQVSAEDESVDDDASYEDVEEDDDNDEEYSQLKSRY